MLLLQKVPEDGKGIEKHFEGCLGAIINEGIDYSMN